MVLQQCGAGASRRSSAIRRMPFKRKAPTGSPCAVVHDGVACDGQATGRTVLGKDLPRGYTLDRDLSGGVVLNASTSGLSGVTDSTRRGDVCYKCYKSLLELRRTGGARGQGSGAPVRSYFDSGRPDDDVSEVRRTLSFAHVRAPT